MKNEPKKPTARLPSVLFAEWSCDDPDDRFVEISQDPSSAASLDDTKIMGRYELVEYVKIVNRTTIE